MSMVGLKGDQLKSRHSDESRSQESGVRSQELESSS